VAAETISLKPVGTIMSIFRDVVRRVVLLGFVNTALSCNVHRLSWVVG
jgi:hypothetical protein